MGYWMLLALGIYIYILNRWDTWVLFIDKSEHQFTLLVLVQLTCFLVTTSPLPNQGHQRNKENTKKREDPPLMGARFTADGLKILTACSWCDCALLWCVETGRVLQRFAPHDAAVLHSSMSHDMSTVATATWDGSLMLWWADSGQLRQKLTGFGEKSKVYVSFSPDDRKVVSAGIHHVAQIWETHGASQRRASSVTLSGHGNSVTSAEFSAEGAWVVTGSYDGTAKIWDSTTGEMLRTLKGHSDPLRSVCFSPH